MKQILLQLDENSGRRRFIIADLDETHVLISPDAVERVRAVRQILRPPPVAAALTECMPLQELEDSLEANHWNPLAVEEQ